MGVEYEPILVVGKEFEDLQEAKNFLKSNNRLPDILDELIAEDELAGYLPLGMKCGYLNCYTDYGYYIGFEIKAYNPTQFRNTFEQGVRSWNNLFKDNSAEVVHTVRIY